MSEIWETLDDLGRALHWQTQRVAELERRLLRLEQNALERPANNASEKLPKFPIAVDRPLERAA